jgi:hypothetical protein
LDGSELFGLQIVPRPLLRSETIKDKDSASNGVNKNRTPMGSSNVEYLTNADKMNLTFSFPSGTQSSVQTFSK